MAENTVNLFRYKLVGHFSVGQPLLAVQCDLGTAHLDRQPLAGARDKECLSYYNPGDDHRTKKIPAAFCGRACHAKSAGVPLTPIPEHPSDTAICNR